MEGKIQSQAAGALRSINLLKLRARLQIEDLGPVFFNKISERPRSQSEDDHCGRRYRNPLVEATRRDSPGPLPLSHPLDECQSILNLRAGSRREGFLRLV